MVWSLNRLGEKCKCNKRIYFLLAVNGYITHFLCIARNFPRVQGAQKVPRVARNFPRVQGAQKVPRVARIFPRVQGAQKVLCVARNFS